MKSFGLPETIWQDVRFAFRTLRKNPTFAAIAVLVVALGIGANTAMFTVIHAVLWKPLAYLDPDRLVHVMGGATPTRFAEMRSAAHSLTPLRLNERPIAKILPVTPGYFHTMGIPLRRGRDFTDHDQEDTERVPIIDENLAHHFWPEYPAGLDPVGQRLLVGGVNPKPATIVGIVGNVRQSLDDSAWPDTVCATLPQNPVPWALLAVRATGAPLSLTRAVRAQVQALDPDQTVASVETMDDLVESEVGQRRLLLTLLGSFAAAALLLALVGIYGVIAYSAAQRTQEVAVRRALGAQEGDILRMMIGQGLTLAVLGIGLGLAGAFALTRLMTSLLFHVSATDPATFVGVAALFLLAAFVASYLPARRATRIRPMTALRV